MTTYKYKGVSPDGARVSGVIKAYDEFEAVSQLRETCSVVTKIEAVPEQKEGGVSFGSHRIKAKELAILCSQFAIILTSGLPIDRCVEMVAAQARSREIQRVLEHVAEDVSGGYSLAQSFTNAGTAFPVTFIETIRAGEQSGTLELCFDRLHKYYDKSAKTHAKLVSTLTYPVLVLIVAAIVFMVIMLFAVPMFTSAFAELGSDLPPITKGLIAVSDFFLHYWWVFVLMILAFCIVRLLLRRSDQGRMFLAAGKLKRSPLKRLHQINASAQFASTMATMLAAGLPVTRSLEVTAGVINNYLFSDSVRRVRQGVEPGPRSGGLYGRRSHVSPSADGNDRRGRTLRQLGADSHRHRRLLRQRGQRHHPAAAVVDGAGHHHRAGGHHRHSAAGRLPAYVHHVRQHRLSSLYPAFPQP